LCILLKATGCFGLYQYARDSLLMPADFACGFDNAGREPGCTYAGIQAVPAPHHPATHIF